VIQSFVKSTVVRLFLPITAAVLLSSPAFAQIAAGSGEVSAAVGGSTLHGSNTVDGDYHVNFGASGGYNFTRNVAVLGEYAYRPLGSITEAFYDPYPYLYRLSMSESLQTYGAAFRYSFLSSGKIVPYGILGAGGMHAHVDCSVSGGVCNGTDGNGGYVSFGGGTSFYLGHHFGLRPEYRFETVRASGNSQWTNFSQLTAGAFYQWGGTHSTPAKDKPIPKTKPSKKDTNTPQGYNLP